MSYASVKDVADRLGRSITDSDEIAQVQAWLDDVEDIISARFTRGGLVFADQVALSDPVVSTVVRVEAGVVVRRLLNPAGLTSVTRTLDDASFTERHEGSDFAWSLSDDDWFDLLPVVNNVNSGAFSVQPGFEPDYGSVSSLWP